MTQRERLIGLLRHLAIGRHFGGGRFGLHYYLYQADESMESADRMIEHLADELLPHITLVSEDYDRGFYDGLDNVPGLPPSTDYVRGYERGQELRKPL